MAGWRYRESVRSKNANGTERFRPRIPLSDERRPASLCVRRGRLALILWRAASRLFAAVDVRDVCRGFVRLRQRSQRLSAVTVQVFRTGGSSTGGGSEQEDGGHNEHAGHQPASGNSHVVANLCVASGRTLASAKGGD